MKSITIRVYGLLIESEQILLSKENIKGEVYTKFPGGGLELGEGIIDCLRREFREELNIEIYDIQHFYTTEDFIASAFKENEQIISIYYTVKSIECKSIACGNPEDPKLCTQNGDQVLYWHSIKNLSSAPIHLPIDKIIVGKIN